MARALELSRTTRLLAMLVLLAPAVAAAAASSPAPAPVPSPPARQVAPSAKPAPIVGPVRQASPALRVEGDDFPELIMHLPRFAADGTQLPLACDQVRARRIDELDPRWRGAVGRIHLDCESIEIDEQGVSTVATAITAYLNPGKVTLARLPVAEVRLMDSDLWSDHQYVVVAPYPQAGLQLRKHIERRCHLAQDNPLLIGQGDCAVTEEVDGLYIQTGAVGGIWVHSDPHDAQRTVYAESWAD